MKIFTKHVPRARDSCTSYATENTDYLTAASAAISAAASLAASAVGTGAPAAAIGYAVDTGTAAIRARAAA
jgi:hypothetical protein